MTKELRVTNYVWAIAIVPWSKMSLRKNKGAWSPTFFETRLVADYLCREYPKAIAPKVAYPIQTYCLDLRPRICSVITFRMVPAPFLREPSLAGSTKSGQAALKMATRVGDLSHHLLSSKKRSFASSPPRINCCPILGGAFIIANYLPLYLTPPTPDNGGSEMRGSGLLVGTNICAKTVKIQKT